MSWRIVVIRGPAKLDLKLGQMMVRQEETTRINLNEMAMLVLENTAISLTACLLSELMERKIKVIFCDSRRNPQSELVPFHGSHDSTGKIRTQIGWTEFIKEQVWTEIVREKIRNQMIHMKELQKPEAELLRLYLQELLPGDSTNREGHAAKVYFRAIFGAEFTRSQESYTNAALNYGYSLLLSAFNREICQAGYLTQLGIFHDNMFNPFNLTSDFMEPFRPIVDREVVKMSPTKFDSEEKTQLINLMNKEITISGQRQYLLQAIRIYCKSIFDVLNQVEGASIQFYEL